MKSSIVSALILLVNVYRFDQRLLKWRTDFEKLMLSEFDIRRLYSIFRQIDVDGSGTIDILESLMFFDVESTRFSRQVFSVMDEVSGVSENSPTTS
jgi:Ca2+-binding EF-hand superfamily protein